MPHDLLIGLLLDRGADTTRRDQEGKPRAEYATENDYLTGTAVYWRLQAASF